MNEPLDAIEEFKRAHDLLRVERARIVARLAEIDVMLGPPRGSSSLSGRICQLLKENPGLSYAKICIRTGVIGQTVASRINELYASKKLTRTGKRGHYRYALSSKTTKEQNNETE